MVDRFSFLGVGKAAGPAELPQVVDRRGRAVLLRGVNLNGLEDYYSNSATPVAVAYPTDPAAYAGGRCPARNPTVESMAVCSFDAGQMRRFGYDVVRVAVSWSLLEPRPGQIDRRYVERIAQVVGWLRREGIYSVIDMHQDAWSKYLYTPPGGICPPPFLPVTGAHEADGAPAWASTHVTPVCQAGAREIDPAVQESFQRFWSNARAPDGVGLQDHFARALRVLALRFAADPAVAGYDIFNEPSPGLVPPPAMDASELFPFYAKVIATVRAGAPRFHQLFFIEPDVTRDVTDQRYAFVPWSTYSSYRGVVYAPHVYTRVFTPDALANAPGLAPLYPVSAGYASAAADARALGLPLWDGEFGIDVASDESTLRQHYASQDQLGVGGALWVWKADGSAASGGFSAMKGPFGRGSPFPSRVKFTDRAYPIYTAGTLRSLSYDPDRASLDLQATSRPVAADDRSGATLIYLPAADRGRIRATGARVSVSSVGGGAREAYVYPRGGAYRVFQVPAEIRLRPRLRIRFGFRRGHTRSGKTCARSRVRARVLGRDGGRVRRVLFVRGRRHFPLDRRAPFRRVVHRPHRGRAHRHRLRARVRMKDGRVVRLRRGFRACRRRR